MPIQNKKAEAVDTMRIRKSSWQEDERVVKP